MGGQAAQGRACCAVFSRCAAGMQEPWGLSAAPPGRRECVKWIVAAGPRWRRLIRPPTSLAATGAPACRAPEARPSCSVAATAHPPPAGLHSSPPLCRPQGAAPASPNLAPTACCPPCSLQRGGGLQGALLQDQRSAGHRAARPGPAVSTRSECTDLILFFLLCFFHGMIRCQTNLDMGCSAQAPLSRRLHGAAPPAGRRAAGAATAEACLRSSGSCLGRACTRLAQAMPSACYRHSPANSNRTSWIARLSASSRCRSSPKWLEAAHPAQLRALLSALDAPHERAGTTAA